MSGIAGFFHRDGKPADPAHLECMLKVIRHRGPAGPTSRIEGAAALGLNVLVNTPEARFESIVKSGDGALSIVADVRLDNREDLARDLRFERRPINEVPDSELLLAAYEKWGEECPTRLLGDFAFAIHDSRRRLLFCARDHFGLKPLIYYLADSVFAFGSEVKAITSLPTTPRRINESRIADFLAGGFGEHHDENATFYEGVWKLPPAHTLTVTASSSSLRRYWRLEPETEFRRRPEEDFEEFRVLFEDAVSRRLRSAKPVGVLLSGGLDSGSIACMAARILGESAPQRLRTYSGVADEGYSCHETPYLDLVDDVLGVPALRLRADQMPGYTDHVDALLGATDDPFDVGMVDHRLALFAEASQGGVTAMLNGVDADFVCSITDSVGAVWLESGRLAAFGFAAGMWTHYDYPLDARLRAGAHDIRSAVSRLFVPDRLRENLRNLFKRDSASGAPRGLCGEMLATRVDLEQRIRSFRARLSRPAETAREIQLSRINLPFMQVANERYDRVAALYGIESRAPFQDKRLVEYCMRLPWDRKLARGRGKYVLRAATNGFVPDPLRWRREAPSILSRSRFCYTQRHSKKIAACLQQKGRNLAAFMANEPVDAADAGWYPSGVDLGGEGLLRLCALAEWLARN